MKNKVWIIILNWNGLDDTIECVESCLKIVYEPYQILIVDNHSSDNSTEVLRRRFPDIPLIVNDKNFGYAGGNNIGIKHAIKQGADYILLLNNDVVVEPGVLTQLVEGMRPRLQATMAAPKVMYYDARHVVNSMGTSMDWFRLRPYLGECQQVDRDQYSEVVKKDILVGCAFMIRSDVPNKIGFLDENFFLIHEEADWCLRNIKDGFENIVVPSAVAYHKCSKSTGNFLEATHYYSVRNFLYLSYKNAGLTDRIKTLCGLFILSLKNILKLMVGSPEDQKMARVFFDAVYDYFHKSMGKCARSY